MFPVIVVAAQVAVEAPVAAAQLPSQLPAPVKAMIDAAIATGDPKAVGTVIDLARKTNPLAADEIDGIEKVYRTQVAEAAAEAERKRRAELAAARFFQNWKGQIELGASRSTGNTEALGFYGAIDLTREGLSWRHKIDARADFQKTNGVTTTERALASWQPNYKIDDRLYSYGLAQAEYDPLLGYDSRFTIGGGLGYTVLKGARLNLSVEGGPAIRLTNPVIGPSSTSPAGRASFSFGWKIAPTLEFKQDGAFYYESGDTSANAQTALDAKLLGDLKARLSYNIQYERNAPPGSDSVDTTSRATLIFSF